MFVREKKIGFMTALVAICITFGFYTTNDWWNYTEINGKDTAIYEARFSVKMISCSLLFAAAWFIFYTITHLAEFICTTLRPVR